MIRRLSILRCYSIVLLVIVALLAGGCAGTGVPTKNAEFLGEWTLQGAHGVKATLTFNADGSFSARNIPRNTFYRGVGDPALTNLDQLYWKDLKNFKGKWNIESKADPVYLVMSGTQPSESALLYRSFAHGKPALSKRAGEGPQGLNIYFVQSSG